MRGRDGSWIFRAAAPIRINEAKVLITAKQLYFASAAPGSRVLSRKAVWTSIFYLFKWEGYKTRNKFVFNPVWAWSLIMGFLFFLFTKPSKDTAERVSEQPESTTRFSFNRHPISNGVIEGFILNYRCIIQLRSILYIWRTLRENEFKKGFSMLQVYKTAGYCGKPIGRIVTKNRKNRVMRNEMQRQSDNILTLTWTVSLMVVKKVL